MRFLLLLCAVLVFGSPLWAQEAFEIAVYPYATAHRGEWEFEGNVNYSRRGTTAFDGLVAPRQGQVRFAAELTRGISDNWEVAGYLLGAQVPDLGFEYAGWRLRSRVSAPRAWRLPVTLGLSVEYETARPAFSESARTLEVTPILERRFGALQLLVNPTLERDFGGAERELEFELAILAERSASSNSSRARAPGSRSAGPWCWESSTTDRSGNRASGIRSFQRPTSRSATISRCIWESVSERRQRQIAWCSRRHSSCRWVESTETQ